MAEHDREQAQVGSWRTYEDPYERGRRHRDLFMLENAVERACQAIYAQRQGYWPSGTERHHIAIALLTQAAFSGSSAQEAPRG